MVRNHDVAGIGIESLGALDSGTHKTDGQQHPRPQPGETMLRLSGVVPQRANVREITAHPDRQER